MPIELRWIPGKYDVPLGELMFEERLNKAGLQINRLPLTTLQVNVGKYCNQACLHCHVEAGPHRTERMSTRAVARILELLADSQTVKTVDITGGAPELHDAFRPLVTGARQLGRHIMDRCNLTVLFEPGQAETAEFLAKHEVEIIASLPCYSKDNVEKQRGRGVFDKSIAALKKLNDLGYGQHENLKLNLVYNPVGPYLPPDQEKLEKDYKRELQQLFGIHFNQLFTITNMPIKRFLHELQRDHKLESYMQLLIDHFNPDAAQQVMCRDQLSIGWDGVIYDCDFNQMLEMPVSRPNQDIWTINNFDEFNRGDIRFDDHCFGCTAGSGSSCGGSIA